MCPGYNWGTHPTIDKPGAQNITVCENQGKQRFKKAVFKKVIGDDTKKTKRLTKIQVLIKELRKRVFKKTKVTQLFKPINY